MAIKVHEVQPQEPEVTASSKEIALIAAKAIDDKKGTDIVIQEVGDLLNVTDYFVICTAANNRRADAIYEEVRERLRAQTGARPLSVEGEDEAKWILLDYGGVVVHIFQPKERDYYRLEQLWDAAPTLDVAAAGIEDAVYSERIASLLGRNATVAGDGVAPAGA